MVLIVDNDHGDGNSTNIYDYDRGSCWVTVADGADDCDDGNNVCDNDDGNLTKLR